MLRSLLALALLLPFVSASAWAQWTEQIDIVFSSDGMGEEVYQSWASLFPPTFEEGVTIGPAPLVLVQSDPGEGFAEEACSPILNTDEVAGSVALIARGSCSFTQKVTNAVEAGAVGAIVYGFRDSMHPDWFVAMAPAECDNTTPDYPVLRCEIPAVFAERDARDTLLEHAAARAQVELRPRRLSPVPPAVGLLETDRLRFTVHDNGHLGSYQYLRPVYEPPFSMLGQETAPFGSSVLLGRDGTVTTNPYYETGHPYSVSPLEHTPERPVESIATPPAPFDAGLETAFSSPELGLYVDQRVLARNGEDFVVVELSVTNTTPAPVDDLYIGLFADLYATDDSDPFFENDLGAYEPSLSLPYIYDAAGSSYYGVLPLDAEVAGYYVEDPFVVDDANLWLGLTVATEPVSEPANQAITVGTGPYDLAPGESQMVRFAYVAGTSQEALFATARAALDAVATSTDDVATPAAVRLDAPYPNPFAETTRLRYTLPTATEVTLAVYDLLGREVAVLTDGLHAVGEHAATLDARTLPSGVYVVRLTAEATHLTERVTIVR